ncbi:MAG: hypothetical protein ACI9N9_000974 [Enterobacterales bacterium]|jgi:hypothetical protein
MKTVKIQIIQSLIIISSCLLLNTAPVNAREVDGLFEISIAVDDQNNTTRNSATRKALVDVMVRISGQSKAASNSIIQSNLKKSTAYIQRYLYREVETLDEKGQPVEQLILDLVFDEMALRNLLRDADLPLWGSNRPQALIWLAIGDQQQRFLMGTDDESLLKAINKPTITASEEIAETPLNLINIITEKAASRGLPILLPLMDLEDSVNIHVADVWGRFITPIRQASERYNSDAIVAAQMIREADGWLTRWLLLHEGRTISWEIVSDSIESSLNLGIDSIADQLAEQYAVYEDSLQRNEILVSVNNVQSVEDFANLMSYLQSITSIYSVNVAKVTASTIQLRVNLIGEQQSLIQAISLNSKLSIESTPSIDPTSVQTKLPALFFRWNSETVALSL